MARHRVALAPCAAESLAGRHKRAPWFEAEIPFDNPWELIGQVTAENRDRLALQPVTPRRVAAIIRQVAFDVGPPGASAQPHRLKLRPDRGITDSRASDT